MLLVEDEPQGEHNIDLMHLDDQGENMNISNLPDREMTVRVGEIASQLQPQLLPDAMSNQTASRQQLVADVLPKSITCKEE